MNLMQFFCRPFIPLFLNKFPPANPSLSSAPLYLWKSHKIGRQYDWMEFHCSILFLNPSPTNPSSFQGEEAACAGE